MLIIIKNVLINFNNNFNWPKMKRTAVSSSSTSCSNKKRCTDESASDPVSSSVKKWSGAAIYKSKFQVSWKQRWPFIAAVPDNVSQFYCNICSKNCLVGTKVKLMSNAILNQLRIHRILTSWKQTVSWLLCFNLKKRCYKTK